MKYFVSSYKLSLSLILVAALYCSAFNLHAQTITDFSIGNFAVVNNTKKTGLSNGSFAEIGTNTYKLTDTVNSQNMVMWWTGAQKINLNLDFQLDMKIYFGSGRAGSNGWAGVGMAFIMHQKTTNLHTLIGCASNGGAGEWSCWHPSGGSLPCTYLSDPHFGDTVAGGLTKPANLYPSFAIGFKSFDLHYYKDGYKSGSSGQGFMQNFSPNTQPYAAVNKDRWYCVRILFKKVNVGGTTKYDLFTFVEEKGNNADNGKMVLRARQRFDSLNQIVSGLSPNNSLVTWGISSVTGAAPNKHQVEFVSLRNESNINNDYEQITVDLIQRDSILFSPPQGDSGIAPLSYNPYMQENLLNEMGQCGVPTVDVLAGKTITNKQIICFDSNLVYEIVITGINMAGIQWQIDGKQAGSATDVNGDGSKWAFKLNNSHWKGKDSITVTVGAPNGTQLVFKLKIGENRKISEKFTEHLWDKNKIYFKNDTGSVSVSGGELKKISLPKIEGCRLIVDDFNSFLFDSIPQIKDDTLLTFQLKSGEYFCEAEIKIRYICNCEFDYNKGVFLFKVKNKDCCESINIQVSEPYSLHPNAISALVGLLTPGSYSTNVIAVDADKPIISWEVNPLLPFVSKTFIVDYGGNKVIVYPCGGIFLEPIQIQTYPVEVCLTFAGNIRCCDTIIISYNCENWFKNVKLFPNIVLEGIINISYELHALPDASTPPLSITVYDQFGVKKMDIMNAIPSQISELLTPNINALQAGHHYVIFQMGNQIEIRPFVKQ